MSTALASSSLSSLSFPSTLTSSTTLMNSSSSSSSVTGLRTAPGSSSSSSSSTTSSASSRGKWSVVGTIVSAPIRGYYYPGRVKAIKEIIKDSSSTGNKNAGSSNNGLIYSIQFSNLDSTPIISNKMNTSLNENENEKQELILDYNGDQLIGRGFEPITKALLSENQKVFITYRNRECSAHVINHDTETDDVKLSIDSMPSTPVSALSSSLPLFTSLNGNGTATTLANNNELDEQRLLIVKLQDIRLLPSRKSGRIQEHPDYSILANGGRSRSPIDHHHHDERSTLASTLPNNKSSNINNNNTSKTMNNRTTGNQTNQRQRTVSGFSLLANGNNGNDSLMFGHPSSAHIDVPNNQPQSYNHLAINIPGRKRRPVNSSMSTAGSTAVDQHYHQYGIKSDFIAGSSMDECTAALVLMSLSAPPRSPTLSTENRANTRRYKCTWPGCKHKTTSVRQIEQHIRDHKQKDDEEMMSGEEDFYYDVEDASERTIFELRTQPAFAINGNHHHHHHNLSSGPDSPVSLSETDAASNSSSSNSSHVLMAIGDNSMDSSSSPPSPITAQNYFQQAFTVSAFAPCVQTNQYRHLEDHEYNRKPDPAGISILGSGTVINRNRGRKSNSNNNNNNNNVNNNVNNNNNNAITTTTTLISSHPINIPNMDHSGHSYNSQTAIGSGSFGASSLSSSGFGSYTGSSLGSSSFSPVSPSRTNNSASLSSTSKYLRMVPGGRNSATNGALHSISNGHHHHGHHNGSTSLSSSVSSAASTNNSLTQQHRTSPTKRIRGETRKCRKMYGMDKKDSWCTQCKWKKACSRFID